MLTATKSGNGRMTARRAYAAAMRICRRSLRLAADVTHPDAVLLAACADYDQTRRQLDRLAVGPARIAGEEKRSRIYDELTDTGRIILAASLSARATTLDGHRARAALFLAWDEGELIGRARRDRMLEDQMLAALLLDLVAG